MFPKICLSFVAVMLCSTLCSAQTPMRESLDDVLKNAQVVQSVKTLGLAVLSQGNPDTAAHDAGEVRRNVWASRPESGLTEVEADVVLKDFDRAWEQVVNVVRERQIKSLQFLGMDLVLLKRSLDWYYGVATLRGPVIIQLSVQYNEGVPMTIHGVQVWTDWEDVKRITRNMDLRAESKVMTVSIDAPSPTTKPAK